MTTTVPHRVRVLAPGEAAARVPDLADVLIDCVEGGASVSFMLPMSRATAEGFWRQVADGVVAGERIVLVAEDAQGRIDGTVQLVLAQPENQPHRADVAKMLVHRRARRRGVARLMLDTLDQHALAAGKSVLVLDTVTGSNAERLYARAGWQRVGSIPNYALMPDGAPCATTYFHKQLAPLRGREQGQARAPITTPPGDNA